MDQTDTPTVKTFQPELAHLELFMKQLNWTFLEGAFCASSSSEILAVWIIFSTELLVICLALYGLCCPVKCDHAVPIFVINLFITDIIQICFKPVLNFCGLNATTLYSLYIYLFGILANIGFMVCISLERYVMMKYPLWYRYRHTLKHSVPLCLLVWMVSCSLIGVDVFLISVGYLEYAFLLSVLIFLMPYPLVVFCFVGSWRALSHVASVSPDERKRILRILALVLFNYTVLFLPSIVRNMIFAGFVARGQTPTDYLQAVSGIMLYLNPLADSMLYFFFRKDVNGMLGCLRCKV